MPLVYEQWRDGSPSYPRIDEIRICLVQRGICQEKMGHPVNAIGTFKTSSRRCMNPEDYVYGVLGVLQFKLPRGIEPNELWQLFVSQVEEVFKELRGVSFGRRAREFDLLTARNMADVYQVLFKNMIFP